MTKQTKHTKISLSFGMFWILGACLLTTRDFGSCPLSVIWKTVKCHSQSTFGQLWNSEGLGETRQNKRKKIHSRRSRAHSSVCVIVFNYILIVHALIKIVSSTGEAEKKDAKTSHRLGGMLGQWMERGRTPNGTGEEAHTLTSQFWHIFPSENQNQLKHQIKK